MKRYKCPSLMLHIKKHETELLQLVSLIQRGKHWLCSCIWKLGCSESAGVMIHCRRPPSCFWWCKARRVSQHIMSHAVLDHSRGPGTLGSCVCTRRRSRPGSRMTGAEEDQLCSAMWKGITKVFLVWPVLILITTQKHILLWCSTRHAVCTHTRYIMSLQIQVYRDTHLIKASRRFLCTHQMMTALAG